MNPKIRYMLKTLHHKWFVFRFGLRTKAPLWRLVIHDWSKFTPGELSAYANHLFGTAKDEIGFAQAWNHHSKTHRHHWEWWIPLTAHSKSSIPAGEPLPMAEWAVREMVADWLGAERSYNKFTPTSLQGWKWYNAARRGMRFHPDTALLLDRVLAEYFAAYGD
ncbi:hypothetical protein HFN89_03600 [Rhizobium laguerreae]|nr:hypothetical protein [Rhizobium laguerreae]